jgi:hypothetical protein
VIEKLTEKIDLLLCEPLLDDWSKGFLESIKDQYIKRSSLSERQLATFNKIQSRFSPQEKEKLKKWVDTYRSIHQKKARVIAQYYTQTSYFSDIARNILEREDYVPPYHRYKKMSENKYAEGVWRNRMGDPKFLDGAKVQFRSDRYNPRRSNRLAMVLNSEQVIISHAKGAKRYLVLLFGESNPVVVEERHLKKPDRGGKHFESHN